MILTLLRKAKLKEVNFELRRRGYAEVRSLRELESVLVNTGYRPLRRADARDTKSKRIDTVFGD